MKYLLSVTIFIIGLLALGCEVDLNQPVAWRKTPEVLAKPVKLAEVFVIQHNDNLCLGTADAPVTTLSKALEIVADSGTIFISAGNYQEYMAKISGNVTIDGGYSPDFSEQNPVAFETIVSGTSGWGDPFPTIILEHGAKIKNMTVKASNRSRKLPCGIYIEHGDTNTVVSNCRIFGPASSNCQGGYGIYINGGNPVIRDCKIDGGNINSDVNAATGIFIKDAEATVVYNQITGGSNAAGVTHGIWTQKNKSVISNNSISGGSSGIEGYSCAIRTGDTKETWTHTGAADQIHDNYLFAGTGYRTYCVVASQYSEQSILRNTLDVGYGTIAACGIYIKTADKPRIEDNRFVDTGCTGVSYGIYEWNIVLGGYKYEPGTNSNAQTIRRNTFSRVLGVLVLSCDELTAKDCKINTLFQPFETETDGLGTLAEWGNNLD